MIDVSTLTANELVSKLQSGEISSVELCNKYLERIKKFEKDVQAWAHLCLLYTSPSPRDS